MSQAVEILTELQRRGVIVAVEGDTLCLKPRRALDDTLLARVREAKPAILEALNRLAEIGADGAACCSPHCAGCYGVGDGKGFTLRSVARNTGSGSSAGSRKENRNDDAKEVKD